MTLEEIKTAVNNGRIVHWSNDGYRVYKRSNGNYDIAHYNGSCIGLTWLDGVTLNGKESEFYIRDQGKC